MFSKYKLQQMGFDYIDTTRSYSHVMDSVICQGESEFRNAYAYGMGMILHFTEEYISQNEVDTDDFKPP